MKFITALIPSLVPITYYIVIGATAWHFGSIMILLFLLLAPRLDTKFIVISSSEGTSIIKQTIDNNSALSQDMYSTRNDN